MTPLETLRALGPGDEAPEDAKQRVLGGVMLAAGATSAVGFAAPADASAAPAPSALVSGKMLACSIGLVLLGGALGAAAHRAFGPADVRIVYVDRAAPLPSAQASPINEALATPAPSQLSVSARAVARQPSRPEQSHGSALARERALLDRARQSAAQGDAGAALAQLERHRQQFPSGHLAEEREAMAVRALLALGQREAAHKRARAFREAYPGSLLSEVVDSAVSSP